MKKDTGVKRSSYARLLILSLSLLGTGCGGGNYSSSSQPSTTPPTPSTVSSMQGSWEILFHADSSPTEFTVLEANLSQSGTHLAVASPSALVFQGEGTVPWVLVLGVSRFGGRCDNGQTGAVTLDGTLTSQQPVAQPLTFTLTENGVLGSAVLNVTASTDGKGTLDGTYSSPAACGFPEEHGTVQGFKDSPKFSAADAYSGTVLGKATSLRFTSAASEFGLSASGTYDGSPLALTGSTTGLSLTLTGTVSGQAITWFGLYDSTYNSFRIYDSDANLVGELKPNP